MPSRPLLFFARPRPDSPIRPERSEAPGPDLAHRRAADDLWDTSVCSKSRIKLRVVFGHSVREDPAQRSASNVPAPCWDLDERRPELRVMRESESDGVLGARSSKEGSSRRGRS